MHIWTQSETLFRGNLRSQKNNLRICCLWEWIEMFRRSHCYFFSPLGCPVIATPPCLPCGVDWDWSASPHSNLLARVHPVVAVGSARVLLPQQQQLVTETRLPHSVMWCALAVCHHQYRRWRWRTDSSGFFSRGCTVLPEGNGGESFRGPFREKRTRTERIDADFGLDLCGEWTWHQRWHAKHAPKWMTHACTRGKALHAAVKHAC